MNIPKTLGGDLSTELRELSEPWVMGDRIKSAIARAARLSGLSYWRAFDLWYRKARRIEPAERECVENALRHKRKTDARNELHELRTRIARLEALLARTDSEFHRPSIGALRDQRRELDGTGGDPHLPGAR